MFLFLLLLGLEGLMLSVATLTRSTPISCHSTCTLWPLSGVPICQAALIATQFRLLSLSCSRLSFGRSTAGTCFWAHWSCLCLPLALLCTFLRFALLSLSYVACIGQYISRLSGVWRMLWRMRSGRRGGHGCVSSCY